MTRKRKTLSVDFHSLEKQPYKGLNTTGKEIIDAIVEISDGKRDAIGRRLPEEPTDKQKAILDMVREAFKELTPKQKIVLNLLFGLDDMEPCTERVAARRLDISQQTVHDLKLRGIKALRKKAKLNESALKKISKK